MTRNLAISLVTLGDPGRLSGGYLYHRRMADAAPTFGARVRFVSLPDLPRLPFPAAAPLTAAGTPWTLGAARRADVIVLDSIAATPAAPWLATAGRLPPLVAVLHQPPGGIDHGWARTRVQARLDLLAYRRARLLIAASQHLADTLVAAGIPRSRLRVVPPGCDPSQPRESDGGEQVVPGALGLDLRAGRQCALLCVANWLPRKGIVELLEAVDRLPSVAVTLHLVGATDVDRRYAAQVRRVMSRPGLAGRVVVHGAVSRGRVAALYQGADVFVLVSVREPYGTVYAEAMAAGLPVVGWRAGNLPHLAEHDQEGLLVSPGDIAGLAAALEVLAGDADHRRRLAAAARAQARSFPTWEATANCFFSVVREVAGG